jgi:enamine deaminase RidA (YjgF/YER057c/UK114 family)
MRRIPDEATCEEPMIITPEDTIARAETATGDIVQAFQHAAGQLQTCYVNQHGVLADPETTYINLRSAQRAIDLAIEVLKETQWPTQATYDAAAAAGAEPPLSS